MQRCRTFSIASTSNPAADTLDFTCDVSSLLQILIGEVTSFFVKTERAQEKTIVTADCCYFNPLLRRIVRFLGQLHSGEIGGYLAAPLSDTEAH